MEWIKTILFLTVIFLHYLLIGELLLKFSNYKKTASSRLILGFFGSFFLGFIIGLPFQTFQFSWNVYFWVMFSVFICIDSLSIYLNLSKIKAFINSIDKDTLKTSAKVFFKNNWVCILFVVLFTVFSVSNENPIHFLNYDDHYYIGKIQNLISADKLMNENYFNGSIWSGSLAIERIVNTYELSYAFLANLFNIYVPFFCRVSMVIHNYIIFAIVYKMVGSIFLKKSRSQFVLFVFFLFLLPNGYLNQSFIFKVTSYDLWQFQTSAFYGGAIVRMISLPSLFVFSIPLLKKIEFKKIIILAMMCLVFISFSTIFLLNFIIFMIVIMIVKFVFMIKDGVLQKNKKKLIQGCIGFVIMIGVLFATKFLDQLQLVDANTYQNALNWLNSDLGIGYNRDYLYKSSILLIPLSFMLCRNDKSRSFILFVAILFALCLTMYFKELFVFGSIFFSFVSIRFLASVSYLLLLNIGLLLLMITERLKKRYVIDSILTLSFASFICVYFGINYDNIRFTPPLQWGSGICELGWDFSRVLDFNTKMVPEVFVELGDYFNTLPYGNYNFYIPSLFYIEGEPIRSLSIHMTTNRVVTHNTEPTIYTDEEQQILDEFSLNGGADVYTVRSLLLDKDFVYYIIFNENAREQLIINNCKEIIKSDLGFSLFSIV